MNWKKMGKILGILTIIVVGIFVALLLVGVVKVSANGLVDDTIDASKEYSKYSIFNYGLDFYVSSSWTDIFTSGVGGTIWKQVSYVIYSLTNFLWTLSLLVSSATGYLIQEAYSLDFVSTMSASIGEAIQAIAGVTKSGFSTTGFYVKFILFIILIVGAYVAYTGLIKRETTKAIKAVINLLVVFIISASFIAYAPDYIGKINEFSSDVSKVSLDVGTKVMMPNIDTKNKDSSTLMRESLFNLQVVQPWLILQYGDSNIEDVGEDRVDELLSVSSSLNRGKNRENVVKKEVEEKDNENMTTTKVIQRLGITVFIVIFDIIISIFVFMLTGTMIFSQVLFIIYAMVLPISFLLSMIPTCEGMSKKAIMKLFNVIMTRAGITLIVTITFSISTMIYRVSAAKPFFFVAFLQIVTFVGIYSKQGDLLSMFSLQSNDSQGLGRKVMNRPSRMVKKGVRNARRAFMMSKLMKRDNSQGKRAFSETSQSSGSSGMSQNNKRTSNKSNAKKQSLGKRMGQTVGNAMDAKNKVADKAGEVKDKVQSVPTNARYAAFKKKEDIERGVQDFVTTIPEVQKQNQEMRSANRDRRRQSVASKRAEMDRTRNNSDSTAGTGQGSGSSNNTTGSGRGSNGSNGTSRNSSGNSTTGTGRGSSGGSRSSGTGRENSNTSGNAQSNRTTSENEKSNYHSSDNASSTSQDRDHYKKSDTSFSDKKTRDKKAENKKDERRSSDSRPSSDWRNNSYRSKKKDANEKGKDNK